MKCSFFSSSSLLCYNPHARMPRTRYRIDLVFFRGKVLRCGTQSLDKGQVKKFVLNLKIEQFLFFLRGLDIPSPCRVYGKGQSPSFEKKFFFLIFFFFLNFFFLNFFFSIFTLEFSFSIWTQNFFFFEIFFFDFHLGIFFFDLDLEFFLIFIENKCL